MRRSTDGQEANAVNAQGVGSVGACTTDTQTNRAACPFSSALRLDGDNAAFVALTIVVAALVLGAQDSGAVDANGRATRPQR